MGVCVLLSVLLCALLTASPVRGDSTCTAPSSPVCYKASRRPDEDFICEWTPAGDMGGFSHTLHQGNETEGVYKRITDCGKQSCTLIYEDVSIDIPLLIWVSAHRDNISCSSAHTSIQLDQSVKYPAPVIEISRSSKELRLEMKKARDNQDADYEIRYKEIRGNSTSPWAYENTTEGKSDVFQMSVRPDAAYELHVRRRARDVRHALWSDETPVIVPVPLTDLAVTWNTTLNEEKNARTLTLSLERPRYEVSLGGLHYNVSYSAWPCDPEDHTQLTSSTEVKVSITLSEARIRVYARNNVGSSPSYSFTVPAVHRRDCPGQNASYLVPKEKKHRKRLCWEWYRLDDGETRPDPAHVHSATGRTETNITQIAGMEDFVRYYYFIHMRKKKNLHTLYSCPVYKTESTPQVSPLNLTVPVVTPTSLQVCWLPIPVAQQRGFLTHYHLCLSGDCENVSESQTCNTFQKLKPGSEYSISVAAATRMGSGPAVIEKIWTSEDGTVTGSQRDVIIIIVSLLAITLLFLCPFLFIRLRSKLPAVPKPVIAVSIKYSPSSQEVHPPKEEVHVVTLEHMQKPTETLCITPEEGLTLLQEEGGVGGAESENTHQEEEEEEDQDHVMKAHECDGAQNPNYKRQTLRMPEDSEMTEKALNECDVTSPVYKNAQVFDMKPELCENGESFV
ncbi:uncharacterized protein LOC134102188 isoform X2 [Sardina pilchardus]|uniref:uncharacterized protein LOC134102188 isoform X2 n=1 Tax=Sardina pilchardus TaxID=27697 RepID=UPI002E0EBF69